MLETSIDSVTKLRPPLLQTNSGVSMTENVVTAPLTGLKSVTKLRPPLLQTMSVASMTKNMASTALTGCEKCDKIATASATDS